MVTATWDPSSRSYVFPITGWKQIARVDGPNHICPGCIAEPGEIESFLQCLKEDGYEHAHIVDL